MITRNSLLYILGVSTLIGALTAQTQITVTEGSTAELICTFKNVQSQEPYIMWNFNDVEVFERKGDSFIAGEGYEGRVDVPEEKLRNGDCTLVLRNVSHNDAGDYESVMIFRRTKRSAIEKTLIQHVTLSVREAPVFSKEVPDPLNDGTDNAERHKSSNDAGMKRLHPMIILLYVLISTALFHLL